MSSSWDRLCAVFWGWLVVSTLTLLIATGIVDSQGAKYNNHPEPMPAGVHMGHDSYSYVMNRDVRVPEKDICHDGTGGADKFYFDEEYGNARWIGCSSHQTWNDHRARSINFAHAFKRITSTWFGPVAFTSLIFLLLVSPLPAYLHERRSHTPKRGY